MIGELRNRLNELALVVLHRRRGATAGLTFYWIMRLNPMSANDVGIHIATRAITRPNDRGRSGLPV